MAVVFEAKIGGSSREQALKRGQVGASSQRAGLKIGGCGLRQDNLTGRMALAPMNDQTLRRLPPTPEAREAPRSLLPLPRLFPSHALALIRPFSPLCPPSLRNELLLLHASTAVQQLPPNVD